MRSFSSAADLHVMVPTLQVLPLLLWHLYTQVSQLPVVP